MADDLKDRPTAALQAEHDAALAKIEELHASIVEHKAELGKRSNARALLINTVMAGQAAALRAAGVPESAVKDAEEYVARERALALAAAAPEGIER